MGHWKRGDGDLGSFRDNAFVPENTQSLCCSLSRIRSDMATSSKEETSTPACASMNDCPHLSPAPSPRPVCCVANATICTIPPP